MTRLRLGLSLLAALFAAENARAEGRAADSLRTRIGVEAAEALGASDSVAERLRGLTRLGAIGTPRALLRLVRALEPGGSARAPEERLIAVRALAAHTDDATARRALSRVLGGHSAPSSTEAPSGLDDLAERTAALALARSASPDALAALGKALESPGRAAAAAAAALAAHPPADLSVVLAAARVPSFALAHALDDLGDQRGFDTLRDLVRAGPPEVRAAAAVALTRLGDYETVELSRRWIAEDGAVALRVAAARILAMAHADDAPRAIVTLLRDTSTTAAGIELALDAPDPYLVPELSRLLRAASGERADDLVACIGRAGGPAALALLALKMDDPALGSVAAYQIARMPGEAAARVLAARLSRPATRRLAARAATARALLLGDRVENLERVLGDLSRSRDAGDRAAGAAGLAALDPARIEAFVASRDDVVMRAAASALLLAPREVAGRVAERWLAATTGDTQAALALALAVPGAAERAPTAALMELVGSGGPAAPLAAFALAARDAKGERERLDDLLESSDPFIRSHVALGLGASKEADAGGRLENAYRLETNAAVRAAIVRAVSQRAEPAERRVLALAAGLDPDADVRAAALPAGTRIGISGERGLAFVPIVASGVDAPAAATVAVEVQGGLVLPAVAAPDGLVVLPGLPPGSVVLRVAPAHERDNASNRGTGWQAGKQQP
jgi:hypothetical protein